MTHAELCPVCKGEGVRRNPHFEAQVADKPNDIYKPFPKLYIDCRGCKGKGRVKVNGEPKQPPADGVWGKGIPELLWELHPQPAPPARPRNPWFVNLRESLWEHEVKKYRARVAERDKELARLKEVCGKQSRHMKQQANRIRNLKRGIGRRNRKLAKLRRQVAATSAPGRPPPAGPNALISNGIFSTCPFCGAGDDLGLTHEPDCLVLQARKALGDSA